MSEISRILDQLHREFEGNAWHGDSVLEILKGVTAEQAATKPILQAHSIWELVLHMTTWKRVVTERIQGNLPEVTDELDWPKISETGEAAWQQAIDQLRDAHKQLFNTVAKLDEARLNEKPGPESNTFYVQIQGVIQHDLYHAGQIAVLKKSFT
jgi:uncharacterized damage-inducible protein DinB